MQDSSPDFVGGDEAYHAFLDKELEYPAIPDRDKRIASVRVLAGFEVETDGSLSDFNYNVDFEILGEHTKEDYEEIESLYSNYYKIAIRNFLLKMPRWKPAQKGREIISTTWGLPIVFRYEDAAVPQKVEFTLTSLAEYVGGNEAMRKFISKNLILPKFDTIANKEEIQLKIYVRFLIEKNGTVNEIKIENKSSEMVKYEAGIIQCFQKMPKWKPAEQNGNPVKSVQRIPVIISTYN